MDSLTQQHEDNWNKLSPSQRGDIIKLLQREIPESTLEEIRVAHSTNSNTWWAEHHMFWGMGVRNLLRKIIPDSELPPVEYDDGGSYKNWDDYYVPAVEHAAGIGNRE